ncbi:MAG: choice-of-anchor tandem repeat GloVer-containing protein [Terriglobales bacterium]
MARNRICDLLAAALLVLSIAAVSTAASAQTFSVLYNFGSNSGDPYLPLNSGIVAQGRDGNLYSGAQGGTDGYGAIFQITPAGALNVLYSFTDGDDGGHPYGGLTLGTDGNFYGTTQEGGTPNYGTIFNITPSGSLATLYTFTGGNDGGAPYAPPVEGTDGNFYGTTSEGGAAFLGTVYKITPAGKFTLLYQFDGSHGGAPDAPLVQGTDGNFYGTTPHFGTNNLGVVFKITPAGKPTVLYEFDGAHGGNPNGGLVQGTDGNFYGTTLTGGSNGAGVVFRMTPSGKLAVLHNMGGTDGGLPYAGLLQGSDGNFYGANAFGGSSSNCSSGCGTIFKITPKGKFPFEVLHNFDLTSGATPYDTPLQHTNGIVYGDTNVGGTGNVPPCSAGTCGVFYNWSDSLPTFISLLPSSGKVGKMIGILGQGFSRSSVVKFDGVQATSVKNTGTTFLSATVPPGALTGSVTVTTGSTTLTSNKTFRVTPQILSFSPSSGKVGTPVMINGVSLTQTSKVTFGGVKATSFTVNSDIQVTATVPTGAITGRIAITTQGGVATSPGVFTVTQ